MIILGNLLNHTHAKMMSTVLLAVWSKKQKYFSDVMIKHFEKEIVMTKRNN